MFQKPRLIELSRQVTASYLMCGLAALVVLGLGVVYVMNSAMMSRKEDALLTRLNRVAAKISVDYIRHGDASLQSHVDQIFRDEFPAYCGIVSRDRFLAHSSSACIGKKTADPVGQSVTLGEIERLRYSDVNLGKMLEYRIPLPSIDQNPTSLWIAIHEPELAFNLLARSDSFPLAFLMPLIVIGAGAFALRRAIRPLSAIDTQLRRAATVPTMIDFKPQFVDVPGPATLGWNRMVQHQFEQASEGSEKDLDQAVSEFREQQLIDVTNSLSDGLVVTDLAGRIAFANQAIIALLDRRADDSLCGESIEDCLRTRWNLPADGVFRDPESKRRVVVDEIRHVDPLMERTLRVTRQPVRSSHRDVETGYVWSVRDVTQQKLSDKMRGQFVDTATHELRTPLTNIKAYSETLALSEITDVEQQKQFLNLINTEATRLARFVDDLLSISSIEVGSLTVDKQETDIMRMLEEVIAKATPQFQQKKITLEKALPEKLPKLRIDKDKTAATLINLLGNAAKYTAEGGRVLFRVRLVENELLIDIEDTGFGVSEDELPKIFDKFFRSSDARVQSETGSGLGLSLAREVIRLQGGDLTVQSELNKGTVFTVTLPAIAEGVPK